MIQAIVFDLGGVIFSSNATSYEGREKLAKKIGIEPKKLQELWFQRKEKLGTGKSSADEFLNEVITTNELSISLEEIKEYIRKSDVIDENMIQLLMQLRKKYALFALTNDVKEWIDDKINRFHLKNYFKHIFSSADIGLLKPDKKIYEYVLKELNMTHEAIIFVDDREENVKAASDLGIKSFHFTGREDFLAWLKMEKILHF